MMRPPFRNVLLTDERLDLLLAGISSRQEPAHSAWAHLLKVANATLNRRPRVPDTWRIPWYYVQPEDHNRTKNILRDDANACYAQAIAYRLTGEPAYAWSAIRFLDAWSRLVEMSKEEDSTLAFSNLFPAFIFAADLLRSKSPWPDAEMERFAEFVQERALPMNCMDHDNNWGNWGLLLALACATYLEDKELIDQCCNRWRYFIETQIAPDGHLPHEVKRNEGRHGIWYSHFALMPQTIAAEIFKVNEIELFDYASSSGRSLKKACLRLVPWIERPETFPYWNGKPGELVRPDYFSYFEILRGVWSDFPVDLLLMRARPMSAEHSAPFLTFTHGVALS